MYVHDLNMFDFFYNCIFIVQLPIASGQLNSLFSHHVKWSASYHVFFYLHMNLYSHKYLFARVISEGKHSTIIMFLDSSGILCFCIVL
jgi:hypothetical protein